MELREDTVADLAALAGVALAHENLSDALDEICVIAARAIPNADGASLTAIQPTGPEVVASSDEWAKELDEYQYEEREGPCIDAARAGLMFRVRDTGSESRWPSYMPRAHAAGAMSVMSIAMAVETKIVGALNIYSRKADAFDGEAVSLGEIIAGHATLATQIAATLHGQRHLTEQLRTAMASRAAIEQAKSIIMATVGCDPDDAFRRLAEQSQHENRKLRELAEELVRRQQRPRPS